MKISYPSSRLASVAHLVVGGKDDEDLGSHGGGIGEEGLCKWYDA